MHSDEYPPEAWTQNYTQKVWQQLLSMKEYYEYITAVIYITPQKKLYKQFQLGSPLPTTRHIGLGYHTITAVNSCKRDAQ